MEKEHKLAADSLSIGGSIIMGTAGAAPAFSVSAATATLVTTVGVLAPASILYCGIIMFGISLAFIHLNKVIVNAGASYAWVSRIFGVHLGFLTGWAVLVASAVFMVSGSIPAATAILLLVDPPLVHDPGWVSLVAAVWISIICAIALKGVRPTAYLQVIMTSFEVLILLAIIFGALEYAKFPAHIFSFSWLSLTQFTPSLFATGALTSVFLYWGWDVTLNLNEETKNTQHAPGWGAFWSVIIIILLFVCFSMAALLVLSDSEIHRAGTNIVVTLADKIFPRPWGYLAILAVILSSTGTLQTTIVQFTRTLFAKGRDGVMHPRYAKLHHTWDTPWVAIIFIWFFGMMFLLLSSNFQTVGSIIKVSVNAISFQVAFYYSLTGFACAWYYRSMWSNLIELLGYIVWPILSALFLVFIACFSIPTFDLMTNLIGIGGILVGLIPLLWGYRKKGGGTLIN